MPMVKNETEDAPDALKIISADRVDGGLQIAFSDEMEGFYSCELLYALLEHSEVPTKREARR